MNIYSEQLVNYLIFYLVEMQYMYCKSYLV